MYNPLCVCVCVNNWAISQVCTYTRMSARQALPEFHIRVAVLQDMGYLDAEKSVEIKGRVACEINSTQVSE